MVSDFNTVLVVYEGYNRLPLHLMDEFKPALMLLDDSMQAAREAAIRLNINAYPAHLTPTSQKTDQIMTSSPTCRRTISCVFGSATTVRLLHHLQSSRLFKRVWRCPLVGVHLPNHLKELELALWYLLLCLDPADSSL